MFDDSCAARSQRRSRLSSDALKGSAMSPSRTGVHGDTHRGGDCCASEKKTAGARLHAAPLCLFSNRAESDGSSPLSRSAQRQYWWYGTSIAPWQRSRMQRHQLVKHVPDILKPRWSVCLWSQRRGRLLIDVHKRLSGVSRARGRSRGQRGRYS